MMAAHRWIAVTCCWRSSPRCGMGRSRPARRRAPRHRSSRRRPWHDRASLLARRRRRPSGSRARSGRRSRSWRRGRRPGRRASSGPSSGRRRRIARPRGCPGRRSRVGAGEPLTVRVDPAEPIVAWRARVVPREPDGSRPGRRSLRRGPRRSRARRRTIGHVQVGRDVRQREFGLANGRRVSWDANADRRALPSSVDGLGSGDGDRLARRRRSRPGRPRAASRP